DALPISGTLPVAVNGQALPSLAPMLAKVSPAVVNISSTSHRRVAVNPFFSDPIMRQFFGLPAEPPSRELVQQSLGSGVIVNAKDGYVLTNNHVIAGADDIKVTLTDGKSYKAKVIGVDSTTDLAVIQIRALNLVALPMADASINPGNSGGALVNLAGELVGINSMIYSPSGASAGLGFAIPSDLAAEV